MTTEKDLLSAVAFCANRENRFPRYDEGCRGDPCPLHPFCPDGQTSCMRCVEDVLAAAFECLNNYMNKENVQHD